MSNGKVLYAGGCLCGALRYEAEGDPLYAGHCYCEDCRKASGSGFVPFIGFHSSAINFRGTPQTYLSKAANGNMAARNFCATCGSLVFGGEVGISDSFTIYAGSLDHPALFHPTVAIFTKGRPDWACMPSHLKIYEREPSADR